MRHAAARMRRQALRLQSENYRKAALNFVREFDLIVFLPFNGSEMTPRSTREILRSVIRSMLTWGHFTFRQRLISNAQEYGKTVVSQDEACTTETCSWCGNQQRVDKMYQRRGCNS